MNINEKVKFIDSLIINVHTEILKQVDKLPENWDGIELRQFIADRFNDCVIKGMLQGKRKKEYKNTMLINNL